MPIKYDWKLVKKADLDKLPKYLDQLPYYILANRNKVTCNVSQSRDHKMFAIRLICKARNCEQNGCEVIYKVQECHACKSFELYQLNEHPTDGNEDPASDDEQQSQRRGLSSHCKKVIEKLIYSKNLTRPKLLHIQFQLFD